MCESMQNRQDVAARVDLGAPDVDGRVGASSTLICGARCNTVSELNSAIKKPVSWGLESKHPDDDFHTTRWLDSVSCLMLI